MTGQHDRAGGGGDFGFLGHLHLLCCLRYKASRRRLQGAMCVILLLC